MIHLDDVAVRLGESVILDGVSASVDSGMFVGLVGPNGAGKTTLLRTVNGRLTPADGRVIVDGDPVGTLTTKELGQQVATVPQSTDLSFDFDVRGVVEMGRNPHRSRLSTHDPGRDRVDWALERTQTTALADRRITAVSGGERQRVLLARALAQDAPVLLLDEPTANLDIHHQVRTLELVRTLVDDDDRTVLAAIHDLDLAARYCDELLLLWDGAVEASGPPETVLGANTLDDVFDTTVAVGRNPVTGTPAVTALADRDPPTARVHVVSGGGRAVPLLYPLIAVGFEVSVGVIHESDADRESAASLGCETVTAPPFTEFTDSHVSRARTLVGEADVTVLADLDVGPPNLGNLSVAGAADRLVVVEDRPFEERNQGGAQARRRYERLRDRGHVTTSGTAVDTVFDVLELEPPARPPRPG